MSSTAPDPSRQILAPERVPFAGLAHDFDRAAAANRVHRSDLRIAGHALRVHAVGDEWADIITTAMGHLRVTADAASLPEITIDVWDVQATGVSVSQRPTPDGSAPPILMKTSDDGLFIGEERLHGATWLDRSANRIVGFVDSASRLNLDERARPFHKMLSAWLEDRGVQFIHSGLVRHRERGILFVGNGGAGKSTSSISCLRSGLEYLGDDFIGLGVNGNRFVGYGLYASCLLNVHHLKRFPDLQRLSHPPNYAYEDKCVLYLTEAFPGCLQTSSSIDAIALPRVVDSELTTFRPATRAETLRAIAPTSVMQLPRPNRAAFERLVELVQAVPSYWLELGRRVDLIPDVVRSLADRLDGGRGDTRKQPSSIPSIAFREA